MWIGLKCILSITLPQGLLPNSDKLLSGDTVASLPAWKHDPPVPSSSLKVPSTNLGSWQPIVTVFRSFWNIDRVWLSDCKMRSYSLSMLFVLVGLCFPLDFIECLLGSSFFLPPYVLSVGYQVSCGYLAAVLYMVDVFLFMHLEGLAYIKIIVLFLFYFQYNWMLSTSI